MINTSTDRSKYIVSPTDTQIFESAYEIQYTITIANTVVFVGKSRNFYDPNDFRTSYQVDCRDFIEAYIDKQINHITSVGVSVLFEFFDSTGSSIGTETKTITWNPEEISVLNPTLSGTYAILWMLNPGFTAIGGSQLMIPLSVKNGLIEGKTINKLEKTDWTDKYGDIHNGTTTNHYEVECFIDPCWLGVRTKDDLAYEKIMLALQNSKRTILWYQGCNISGMTPSNTNAAYDVHIKDVERIETYSSYSGNQKVPTYKITIEIYNH